MHQLPKPVKRKCFKGKAVSISKEPELFQWRPEALLSHADFICTS